MRVDLCRKCGKELKEFNQAERCSVCGKEFSQFACASCNMVTEPQYHTHNYSEASLFEQSIKHF
jgi:predicted amidophosphoribosyltransferase